MSMYTPQPPSVDEKPHFSDRLPPSLVKIYAGLLNSPARLAVLILGVLIIAMNFTNLKSIYNGSFFLIYLLAGLIAYMGGVFIHKELQERNRDFFLLTPTSATSTVWGNWLAAILPLCSIGIVTLSIDLGREILGDKIEAVIPPAKVTLLHTLMYTSHSGILVSFLCSLSLLLSVAYLFANCKKINLLICIAFFTFVMQSIIREPNEELYSLSRDMFSHATQPFSASQAWISYALMNGIFLFSSGVILSMCRYHYTPTCTWRPWILRLCSIIPITIVSLITITESLTSHLTPSIWGVCFLTLFMQALADCLFFAPRAGSRSVFFSRLWFSTVIILGVMIESYFNTSGAWHLSSSPSFLAGICILTGMALAILGMIFGAQSSRNSSFIVIGILLATILITSLDTDLITEYTLELAIGVCALYLATSFWGGFRFKRNHETQVVTSSNLDAAQSFYFSDLLPADLVKTLRQCAKNPITMITAIIALAFIFFTYEPDSRHITIHAAWATSVFCISSMVSSLNKKELQEKGNNFFLLTPQSSTRIVFNQWLSGMTLILIISAILLPLSLSHANSPAITALTVIILAGAFQALLLLLQGWANVLKLGAGVFFIALCIIILESKDIVFYSYLGVSVILLMIAVLLMARRYYESSNAHDMLIPRLLALITLGVSTVFCATMHGSGKLHKADFPAFDTLLISMGAAVACVPLLDCLIVRDPRRSLWKGPAHLLRAQGTLNNIVFLIISTLIICGLMVALYDTQAGFIYALFAGAHFYIYIAGGLILTEAILAPSSKLKLYSFILCSITIGLINSYFLYLFECSSSLSSSWLLLKQLLEQRELSEELLAEAMKLIPFIATSIIILLIISYKNKKTYLLEK